MKKNTTRSFLPVALLAATLGGCAGAGPKENAGTFTGALAGGLIGAQFGKGEGRIVAATIGALAGGLIGANIGRSLDEADRQAALEAEYRALEDGPSGRAVAWDNPDSGHRGEVIPGPAYEVNSLNCRDYAHTIFVDGQTETLRGTACRQPDGTWRPVT